MSRYLARFGTYLITSLLAAVWVFGALEAFTRPLFDLGRPHGEYVPKANPNPRPTKSIPIKIKN